MNNLRVDNIAVTDSTNLVAYFTSTLVTNLNTSNVKIVSQSSGAPNPEVLNVKVVNNTLQITCQPLTPRYAYNVIFSSTSSYPFKSLNGESVLLEDNVGNLKLIIGPAEAENPIRILLRNFLQDNIYNSDDPTSLVYKLMDSFSVNLAKALYDLRQVKNENYLTNIFTNEEKTRGTGPFDRLNEESAYEIIRVGLNPSGNSVSGSYNIESFPFYPFSLQSTSVNKEILYPDSVDVKGKFNINSLVLNLNNEPAIKLNKLTFIIASSPSIYEYPLDSLGYQIKDNKYDQELGFKYLLLQDNQIKINEKVIQDPDFKINLITRIECTYEYKDSGKIIYPDSLRVEDILISSRETLPPIINIFDLKHAPIVNSKNEIPKLNGIIFIDPNSIDLTQKHPAFLYEKEFRLEALPSYPGEYSVDYANGRVYVFGGTYINDGTGPSPPVATYSYRLSYNDQIDYVYDTDTKDLVSLPNGKNG